MDELIENLQTYELNKQWVHLWKKEKKENFVSLKIIQSDGSEDEDEMDF